MLSVRAETFPPRYNLHKYWGKKPGNVVAAYIAHFAEPGGVVLDPFAGSGVVLCEALLAKRRAIAVDLNPIAGLITRVTVEGAPPDAVLAEARRVLDALQPLRDDLFAAHCNGCGARGELVSTAFDGERPIRATIDCPACGTVTQPPSGNRAVPDPGPFPDAPIYPGWQMKKLARRGLRRWSELFTPRNLSAVAWLRRALDACGDPRVRRALLVSFTAHLAQATRMIADYQGRAGGPSWKLNSYWLPTKWQELNPFRYFDNRVERTARGLRDAQSHLARPVREGVDYTIHTASTDRLADFVPRASVGYVFTDPPYGGEGIQYGELSMLWNLWAGQELDLAREVAFNPSQQKDAAHYERRLGECLSAVHDALAPGAWATITFANKDPSVWRALRDGCKKAGFVLEDELPMAPSAPNITNIVSKTAPKEDMILNYRKPPPRRRRVSE